MGVTSISEEDTIVSATGDGKFPMTSEDDVANAAVGPLIDERSVNGEIFIIGPELLTYDLVSANCIIQCQDSSYKDRRQVDQNPWTQDHPYESLRVRVHSTPPKAGNSGPMGGNPGQCGREGDYRFGGEMVQYSEQSGWSRFY